MKTNTFFLLCTFYFSLIANSQIRFQKNYDSIVINSALQTTDGKYILAGGRGRDAFLMKTEPSGDVIWTKLYGGSPDYCRANSVQQTSDGGLIFTGSAGAFGWGSYKDIYVVKTNGNGDTSWTRSIRDTYDAQGMSVKQTSDGGYAIAGYNQRVGAGGLDFHVLKLDAAGNLLWSKNYGGLGDDSGMSLALTTDGGLLIVGSTASFGNWQNDIYIIKIDGNGNLQWSKVFGGSGEDYARSVVLSSDSTYVIAGTVYGFGPGNGDYSFIMKIDINGNVLWSKIYGCGSTDDGYIVKQCNDGGYILAGITHSYAGCVVSSFLLKTDISGNMLWHMAYGSSSSNTVNDVFQTADDGFVIGAYNLAFPMGRRAFFLKTDSNGNSGCDEGQFGISAGNFVLPSVPHTTLVSSIGFQINPPTVTSNVTTTPLNICFASAVQDIAVDTYVSVSPNPFISQFRINKTAENSIITLTDVSGKQLLKQQAHKGETNMDMHYLSPGLYILTYVENEKVINIKIKKN